MTQEMKPNTQGIRLCKRCGLNPEANVGHVCIQCRMEIIKIGSELKQK